MNTRLLQCTNAISLILTLAAWGQSDDLSDLKERLAIVEQRLDRIEAYRVVDKHVCTDEYEQALDYTTGFRGHSADIPTLWDGTPFIVDISSMFPNAYQLLDAVREEAERIREFLGYEIFVAGNVLALKDMSNIVINSGTGSQISLSHEELRQLIPPQQHIEIRCCYGDGISSAGTAFPSLRVTVLENDAFQSRHIITHELYHLLGFTHPGGWPGIEMSQSLMYGPGHDALGWSIPTQPTPLDLARLACIYDQE